MDNNKTLCAAFWMHTNIRGNDNIFPCCRFKYPVLKFNGSLSTILVSNEYDALREKSLNGIKNSGCNKCYYEEENGKKSLRQKFNEENTINEIKLKFLEIGFDNICNLTCDGCWDDFSSAWSKKNGTLVYTSTTNIDEIPNTIEKILFLGGEPLMTNRHELFLQKIEYPSNVTIIYNTNGTFLLKDNTVKLLRKFKKVTFILSIDGYSSMNEKVRSGSVWHDIIKFITQIKQNKFTLEINSVLHLNNWTGILDLETFVNSLNVHWTVNLLTYPKNLDIKNCKNKEKIIKVIKESSIPNKEFIINHLMD